MAQLNFNLLRQEGPTNLYEGFAQGQQLATQNALVQQEAAQKREFGDLRKQQIMSEMRASEQTQNRALIAERTQQYKDRLLRAGTPDAVRNLIRQRHADPILGPATREFGSLDDDLAEVPDDVNALPDYLSREAMGAAEFIKSQQENRNIARIMGGGVAPAAPAAPRASGMNLPAGVQPPGDFSSTEAMGRVPGVVTTPIPESPPMNAMAPAPTTAAPPAQVNALRPPAAGADAAELRRQRDALLLIGGPRAKALADKLQLDITAAQQKLPSPPASIAEFERAQIDPAFAQFLLQREASRRPLTTVTMPPQEKAEQGERGKMLVKDFTAISQQAANAQKNLPSIDSNLNILNKGFETGFGTDAVAAGAKVLGALGVKGAENFATNAQVFLANANEAVLQKQIEQKGTQTKSDAERIEQTGAKLGNTKDGNRFILTVAKEQLNRDIEQRKFYADWYKRNKTYDGAEDAWFDGPGNRSLFDRPALKAYGASSAAQIPTAATPARAAPAPAAIPQAAIDALKTGRGTDAQFDAIFGPGAAKQARGR